MSLQDKGMVNDELGIVENQDGGLTESNTDDKVTPEDLTTAFTEKLSDDKSESEAKDERQAEQEKREPASEKKSNKKKHNHKKLWIGVLIIAWLLLIGGAVCLAFSLRPKIETASDEEVFRWNEAEKEAVELVDVNFYDFYDTNAVEFYYPYRYMYDEATGGNLNAEYDAKLSSVPQIKGLKNHEVQTIINNRIVEVAQSLNVPEGRGVDVRIGCNMFNVLSLLLSGYDEEHTYRIGLSFDLTTGNELTFDDIFVKGANVESMVFKRFYNQLSSNYSFEVLYAERGIQARESGECYMWCDENVSLEEYRMRKERAEDALANIEEIAMNDTMKYLAGEKLFYLENAGPVFIYNNNTSLTDCFMADDVGFFAYLGKYRTIESIYEDDTIGVKHLFLSAVNAGGVKHGWIEEGDKYFVDYLDGDNSDDWQETEKILHGLVKTVMDKSDDSKYYYIAITNVSLLDEGGYWVVWRDGYVYEMDKEYYDKTYRKVIFDRKTHRVGAAEPLNPLPSVDAYGRVTSKILGDYGIPNSSLLSKDGILYEKADDLFIPGVKGRYVATRNGYYDSPDADEIGWRELLADYYYANAEKWEGGRQVFIDYTNEEKAGHTFRFEILNDAIRVDIKKGDGDFEDGTIVNLHKIPNEYLKDTFKHQ